MAKANKTFEIAIKNAGIFTLRTTPEGIATYLAPQHGKIRVVKRDYTTWRLYNEQGLDIGSASRLGGEAVSRVEMAHAEAEAKVSALAAKLLKALWERKAAAQASGPTWALASELSAIETKLSELVDFVAGTQP